MVVGGGGQNAPVLLCSLRRLVWLLNISLSLQRTCPPEERPQSCYCSDEMSIKHHFVEERERKSGGVNEQPEQKVITDNYGKRRRRREGLQRIDSRRQDRRRKQSFSLQLANRQRG